MKAKQKKSNGLGVRILWILILVFSFLLLLSILSPLFNPDKYWIPAFFGLAYPYLAALILIFALLMGFFNVKKSAVPVIIFLIGIGPCRHTFHFSGSSNHFSKEEADLTLLSQNVHLFGVYDKESHNSRDSVLNLIRDVKPDVCCFQEFYHPEMIERKSLAPYFDAGNFTDYSVTTYAKVGEKGSLGMIIFSRFPIVKHGAVKNPVQSTKEISAIWCDLLVLNDTIRVYNIHLQSIGFSREDEMLFDGHKKDDEDLEKQSKSVVRKLKRAFVARAQQVDDLAEHIRSCKHPVFLSGDFNDTPVSYTYRKLRGDLSDAFLDSGPWGMGKTYRGPYPSFRIDYILYPSIFEAAGFTVVNNNYSDHYPITCRFRIKKDE